LFSSSILFFSFSRWPVLSIFFLGPPLPFHHPRIPDLCKFPSLTIFLTGISLFCLLARNLELSLSMLTSASPFFIFHRRSDLSRTIFFQIVLFRRGISVLLFSSCFVPISGPELQSSPPLPPLVNIVSVVNHLPSSRTERLAPFRTIGSLGTVVAPFSIQLV